MKTKHTPGPWKVSTTYKKAQYGKFNITSWANQRQSICRLSARENYTAECAEADARLIAAAPDLLKIAQAYHNHLRTAAHTDGQVATYEHIAAVIAKATNA